MKWYVILFVLLSGFQLKAQKYFTKDARVSFFSKASLENIEAHNKKGVGIIDTKNGAIEFSVLLKGFEFEKALMQEHFNENYVESDKYPKAVYKGIIKTQAQWKTDGVYKTIVEGMLTLHGVTKSQKANAVINIKDGVISANADMQVTLADYKIKIPSLVGNKISKTVNIAIAVESFKALNK